MESVVDPHVDIDDHLRVERRQMNLYARDLRRVVLAQQQQRQELEAANRQLLHYAQDLRAAFFAAQAKASELERAHRDSVMRLIAATAFRDKETGAHVYRIGHYAKAVAEHLGWRSAGWIKLAAAATCLRDRRNPS